MGLQYLVDGDEHDDPEPIVKAVPVVKGVVVEEDDDEVQDWETDDEIYAGYDKPDTSLLVIPESLQTLLGDACAYALMKRIPMDDYTPEQQRFIFEEIAGAVEMGLSMTDFTEDNFDVWYNADLGSVFTG